MQSPGHEGEIADSTVEAARRGDRDAVVAILQHYDRRMRVVAYRLLKDRQAMDDVLQDVAVKALRGLKTFRGEAPLGAWLCRIVTTTCLDDLRRHTREDPTEPDELGLETPDETIDQDGALDARAHLSAALNSLPVDQRAAVLLIDQLGYDFRSAAEALRVPMGTVSSRVAKARARLRAALLEAGEGA
jgi:RNA polymerase sigma-70 factor, ECF subfamily